VIQIEETQRVKLVVVNIYSIKYKCNIKKILSSEYPEINLIRKGVTIPGSSVNVSSTSSEPSLPAAM
jgi:hypothetical protein